MGTLGWLVVVFVTNAITLMLFGICAAGGADDAYREGYGHGREVGRREGFAAGLAGDELEEAA